MEDFRLHFPARKLLLSGADISPDRSISLPPSSPPFDSSVAMTVLVLLAALFFIGFFSVYIRRFADENSVDLTRRRRTHDRPVSKSDSSASLLPLFFFGGSDPAECAVCLVEFDPDDSVKFIPSCRHVFHPGCIDTWLEVHVSCPLCRTTRLFPGEEGEGPTGERCDAVIRPFGVRRASSFSGTREIVPSLPRTYSL